MIGGFFYPLSILVLVCIFMNSCKKDTVTPTTAPELTTKAASDVTQVSATSGGNINSDGGSPITARGICWSTNTAPTIADHKTTDGAGVGDFSKFNNRPDC